MKVTPDVEAAIRAAGLAGVKSLTIRVGGEARAAPAHPVIAEFEVEGRAVPWKAPTVTKQGTTFKDKTLLAWQATVARWARLAMAGRDPYPGPVLLELHFHLTRRPGSVPDVTNLTKSLEDSLQGVVIENDRQVFKVVAERTMGDRDFVRVRVTSLMGGP